MPSLYILSLQQKNGQPNDKPNMCAKFSQNTLFCGAAQRDGQAGDAVIWRLNGQKIFGLVTICT